MVETWRIGSSILITETSKLGDLITWLFWKVLGIKNGKNVCVEKNELVPMTLFHDLIKTPCF